MTRNVVGMPRSGEVVRHTNHDLKIEIPEPTTSGAFQPVLEAQEGSGNRPTNDAMGGSNRQMHACRKYDLNALRATEAKIFDKTAIICQYSKRLGA